MEKINVVLVVSNKKFLTSAVRNLDLDKVNLEMIIADNEGEKFFCLGEEKFPLSSFVLIDKVAKKSKDSLWLLSGYVNSLNDLLNVRNFLIANNIPGDNIVNFEISSQISPAWIANLRYVEKNGADFFATGNEYMQANLDLTFIPHIKGRGVNLADSNQDLQQSFLTAKYIFEHVKSGTIKFVLIGLTPYSLRYENAKDFPNCSRNLQYMLSLNVSAQNTHDELLNNLIGDLTLPSAQADLNFDAVKAEYSGQFSAKSIIDWQGNANFLTDDAVNKNLQILRKYVKLCLDNGAKLVGVIFPSMSTMIQSREEELLAELRKAIRELEENSGFTCVDMFDLKLEYKYFYSMTRLNEKGRLSANSLLSFKLYAENLITIGNFCNMSYDYFHALSNVAPKDDYNAFMERVFDVSAKGIGSKRKIQVAFVLYDASMWCGDEVYKRFADNERFDTKIFLCLRMDRPNDELVRKDFLHGVEQFKSHGFNVIAPNDRNASVPAQDLLIFLTPYFGVLPLALRPANITAKTLMAYIPYALAVSKFNNANHLMFHTAWKLFFQSAVNLEIYEKNCNVGMPRGIFSGHPKTDVFFHSDMEFHLNWKMAQPDAKKIIWAPHWTINSTVKFATFQWNYKFMYEFAKAHPEISWVLKPHPNLLFSAVREKVFPTVEAFKEYLQAWDDLPNAQVYTGGYYQAIFLESDGMIHDSSSFNVEYQFTHKPMIFLTREGEKFNKLGSEILKVAYRVDGKDLEGIAALMQKIFIEGNDEKFNERKRIFDEYLNYPKYTGMSASEFIYKSIADGLKGEF